MSDKTTYPLLETIDDPAALRRLDESRLGPLAAEIRQFMLHSVGQTGGHLAASLGTVELTLAAHYVYATPRDRLVWDVGHQSYAHKIITGRRAAMAGLRQQDGISGFPRRDESEYDTFGVGHSSTSISAALGMSVAAARQGVKRDVVAIIGDGAMTAGMAFEALNHAGDINANLLVILNDNDMSISENVGGLSNYLARVLSGSTYAHLREGSKMVLRHMPSGLSSLARRAEEHVKGMVVPGTLFEELGFNYIGPIDGHDLPTLVRTLRNVKQLGGAQLLHVITRKGKGYAPAEAEPIHYHGVTAFDPETGKMEKKASGGMSYTQVFGSWICAMAERDERLVGITPAMREGSGLVEFSQRFPERYFDVGIAEQHSVTFAAGLACEGMRPVVAIYSTFLQRAYDQVIHDVAIQNLPVLFAIDRAGLVGADGATHAGSFDYSFLRCIPNLVVMAPSDANECRDMLYTGHLHDGPAAVRYPRGAGPAIEADAAMRALPIGRAEIRRHGQRIAILSFGSLLPAALEAGAELDATVVDMRFVKPLDEDLVLELAAGMDLLVTLEENVVMGGAGSAVNECLAHHGAACPVINLGLPDRFVEHGEHGTLLAQCGLDARGIAGAASARLAQHKKTGKLSGVA